MLVVSLGGSPSQRSRSGVLLELAKRWLQQQGVEVALGHDRAGKIISGGWRRHPEQAAAGLWSTASDLARFAIETTKAYQGNSTLLAPKMRAHAMSNGKST